MKLIDKIISYKAPHPFYILEFSPPETEQDFEDLLPRIGKLAKLDPLASSITWGAGGCAHERSLELAGLTQTKYGLDALSHLTCTNMDKRMIDDVLREAKNRGIQSVPTLRGDPPRGEQTWVPVDPRFQHGVDLVSYIRSNPEFSSHFCIGVPAYPDGHPGRLNDEEAGLNWLKMKVEAGADFIVTQLFFDVDHFVQWMKKVRAKGECTGISLPVIPGIMPIHTYTSFMRIIELTGARVPASVMTSVDSMKDDEQRLEDYGVELAVDMIKRITAESDISGFHITTLNTEKSTLRVLECLGWTGALPHGIMRM